MNKFYQFHKYVFLRDSAILPAFKNVHAPQLKKIIVQISFKSNYFKLSKVLSYSLLVLEYLTNQKATFSFSKKDVAAWRLRKNQLVSVFVTLRGDSIFSFVEKTLFTLFPKISDHTFCELRSQSTASLVITDFIAFPELEREVINLTKKNSFFGSYKISMIFVFNSGVYSRYPANFLLSQLQLIPNIKN
jgi:ribosomal protein L5